MEILKDLVSTIIPVYNRPDMLVDAVKSVLNQTYQAIEIIIVNDGSTDNTGEVADRLALDNIQVSVIHISNGGPGVAREAGRLELNGEYVQYLDSDDVLYPEKFEVQVDGLKKSPNCGISYCRMHYTDMEGHILDHARMRTGEVYETMFPAMLQSRIWGTCAPLYRRRVVEQAGPWSSLVNQEDWEYDCRIASYGTWLHYCKRPLAAERVHLGGHFGQISEKDLHKLGDLGSAYRLIYQHAMNHKPRLEKEVYRQFSRQLFFTSRKLGGAGLAQDSKEVFLLAVNLTKEFCSLYVALQWYRFGAFLVGWESMGTLCQRIDKLRGKLHSLSNMKR